MEPPNDHYDSPWKEAIEHYFQEFMRTPYFAGFSGHLVTNPSQKRENWVFSRVKPALKIHH